MFAIIKTGGKQYRVQMNTVFKVEKLEAEIGAKFTLNEIVAIGPEPLVFGAPLIANATVEVEVVNQQRAKKIIVFKKKRRQNYRRTNGHRQHETVLKVVGISQG